MLNQPAEAIPIPVSPTRLAETLSAVLRRVYLWMGLGLAVTAGVAYAVANSSLAVTIISNTWLFFGLLIAEVAMVIAVSAAIQRLSIGAAQGLFLVYSALNGATMSVIFLVYTFSSISQTFFVAAGLFALISIIGYTTRLDLSAWRSYLLMGLIGFVLASVVNLLFNNSTFYWILTYAGIVLFLALTVYDTQRIKTMASQSMLAGETAVVARVGMLGALRLYLDFVNLFLLLLRVFGRRRR